MRSCARQPPSSTSLGPTSSVRRKLVVCPSLLQSARSSTNCNTAIIHTNGKRNFRTCTKLKAGEEDYCAWATGNGSTNAQSAVRKTFDLLFNFYPFSSITISVRLQTQSEPQQATSNNRVCKDGWLSATFCRHTHTNVTNGGL